MARKRYPSDLTDKQWRIFSGYVPPPKDGGRPAEIERREIVNAILYVTTQGISCLGQSGTVLSRTAPNGPARVLGRAAYWACPPPHFPLTYTYEPRVRFNRFFTGPNPHSRLV